MDSHAGVDLVESLSDAHQRMRDAYWTGCQVVAAAQQFKQAADLAEGAGEQGEALLGALYGATASGADTTPIVTALRSMDRGDEYIRQVNEARRAIG